MQPARLDDIFGGVVGLFMIFTNERLKADNNRHNKRKGL